jgi:Helicase conserved C-terminal domain
MGSIANGVEKKYEEAYDIFISTNAYGVGINLQDASVVINYDLSWTAIKPIQRAGRVLRPWIKPRTVELYSFFPPIEDATLQDLGIAKRPGKLGERHDESLKILELPVSLYNHIIPKPLSASISLYEPELNDWHAKPFVFLGLDGCMIRSLGYSLIVMNLA